MAMTDSFYKTTCKFHIGRHSIHAIFLVVIGLVLQTEVSWKSVGVPSMKQLQDLG